MPFVPSDPSLACVRQNGAGFDYEELSCLYPGLGVTDLELAYDPHQMRNWMVDNPWAPILACVLYGLMIIVGRAYFADKPAWSWRRALAAWNLGLSIFSAIGFYRTGAQLVHNLSHYSFYENLCNDPENQYGSGTTGLWVQLFVLSKFPELIDTFFIIIHKKPLIFLHWYHHVTVLLYCWHSYVTKAPSGIFFCVMNYFVHSIMYGYYFLMAIRKKPKWMNAMIITVAQISQMVVGVALTALGFYFVGSDDCWIQPRNNTAAFVMYGSYLFLFLEFFFGRYFGTKLTAIPKKKVA